MAKKTSVYFRCDAGLGYGLGHLMRSIALAQALRRVGIRNTTFLVRELSHRDIYDKLLGQTGFDCVFLPEDAAGLQIDFGRYRRSGCLNIMVFDNYDVSSEQMIAHRNKFGNLVAIDDLADRVFCADIIVNQNLSAETLSYKTIGAAKILSGPSYAMLREQLLGKERLKKDRKDFSQHRIFMSFGGADVMNRIRALLMMLKSLDRSLESKLHIDFAIANNEGYITEIKTIDSELLKTSINLVVGEYDLSSIMQHADLAVTAAGSSVFEFAFLGIPQLAVIIDRNQEVTGWNINEHGFGVCLGFVDRLSEKEFIKILLEMLANKAWRSDMSMKGCALIDGYGADRVAHEITNLYAS